MSLGAGAATAVLPASRASATPTAGNPPVTRILGREVDTSRATPEVVRLLKRYFEDKTARDVEATMAHFSRTSTTYIDAILGWPHYSWESLHSLFAELMPTWPQSSASYPTRIVGDEVSALVFFTDTPELFGHELRIMGAVNFEEGRIVRWIDYWDGRAFTLDDIAEQRTPAAQFPTDFAESYVGEPAAPIIRSAAHHLSRALAAGDAQAASSLLSEDVVLEDLALHITLTGRRSIRSFLTTMLPTLPYGAGSALRHVVGSARGGGYEWTNPASPAPRGVTGLELGEDGRVSRVTSVWDSSLWHDAAIARAQAATILH
ncbi:hypothetical protein [Streptomyces sp. Inha503]|uniref:hypothetical protein n=1 Tax=Streptomyces sp. Inha503 TaxID=3383314 RepID=UPI0039A21572